MPAKRTPDVQVGQRFGRLTVTGPPVFERRKEGRPKAYYFPCLCDCGGRIEAVGRNLLTGNTQSCGCRQRDRVSEAVTTHGESKTKLYWVWLAMRDRCQNPSNKRFEGYGGRGIAVCQDWDGSYGTFRDWAVASGYREGLTIERIDNDGDYGPGNCTWIPVEDQAKNTRRKHLVTAFGETKRLSEWMVDPRCVAKAPGMLMWRLKAGWSPEDAITKDMWERRADVDVRK